MFPMFHLSTGTVMGDPVDDDDDAGFLRLTVGFIERTRCERLGAEIRYGVIYASRQMFFFDRRRDKCS